MTHGESLVQPSPGELDHECHTCGEKFRTLKGMRSHHTQKHGESLVLVTFNCRNCGLEVTRYGGNGVKFCSQDCFFDHRRKNGNKVLVACGYCGEGLNRFKSRVEKFNRQFCDEDCLAKHYRENTPTGRANPQWDGVKVECGNCGGVVYRRPSYVEQYNNIFCSAACRSEWQSENLVGERAPHWEGGEVEYGAGWTDKKKDAVRERDGRVCQNCGLSEEDHLEKYGTKHVIHHIQKARRFDDPSRRHDMDNLITLCRGRCHQRWEKLSPLRPMVD